MYNPTTMPTHEDKIAIAWFLAGEGTITLGNIRRGNGQRMIYPRIRIVNNDKHLLEKIKKMCGCGAISTTHKERKLPLYQWEVHSQKRVKPFLEELLPYLPSERHKKLAELVIKFCISRESRVKGHGYTEHELHLLEMIRELNGRGDKDWRLKAK